MCRLEGSLRGTLLGSSVALPDMGTVPYIRLAIGNLRLQAQRTLSKWGSVEVYVKNRLANRMLKKHNPSPSPAEIRKQVSWARGQYSSIANARLEEAAQLQKLASDLERKAAAEGLLLRSPLETPTHRPPSSTDLQGAGSEGVSSGEFVILPKECILRHCNL
ncbi:UNVERIFIED_CONTAM: KRUF family protein [Hammondia hammondi]|eukprot:XP_008888996.1 KRUF family protein [Hammondia hammondi]